jgi:hypothetical protein
VSGKARTPGRPDEPSPPENLLEQRESFIQTFFKKGAELTEELLREDERLRKRLRDLEAENALLRAQVASDDAIRDLFVKIEKLEKEKKELLSRITDAQASGAQFASRFSEIEEENAKLASLYVASHQLHSTLDLRAIVRQLKELLAQFVGARAFAIYLVDDSKRELVPIASEGALGADVKRMPLDTGIAARVVESGQAEWVEGDATSGTTKSPAAAIPLILNGRPVGAIVVFSTFEQKREFVEVDFELFRLLGQHAASALVASRLFEEHGAKIGPVESFLDLE